ncbi:DnaJ -like protein subfamily C member 13 [Trichinella nelsoni]|uniref:DnaJ-like protein subfamily C member 13 n=1 Tax=Trichinella nelsoni TaxID=6336 RepID=A0A0V0RVR9_9BILA|nr:DnaJ -like protein subfamily C member 13 [Trichinella nelsoni]
MDGINNEILCFMVVKRSWKGRYRRLLAIGPNGYSTYNPANLHLTNHWVHSDVIALKPCVRGIGRPDEFSLMVRIRSKPETFRFCSEETVEILTDILRVKRSLSEFEIDKNDQWEARKVHWSGSIVPIALEASTYGLLQLNKVSGEILAEYSYKDILCIYLVSDVADAFIICCSPYRRLHMFRCADVEKLIKRVEERSMENIGIACKVNANSVVESFYKQNRLGLHNIASHLTSIVEFNVTKFLARHPEPVQRLLCLSEACLIERDVSTYNVVTLKPLTNIASLIRCDKDPHLFYIEYSSGRCGVYMSVERDDLLASILDGVRAAGNVNVHVGMRRKNLALRWAPSGVPVDTESKLTLMKFITSSGMSREEFLETLRRFNSNIPYGGPEGLMQYLKSNEELPLMEEDLLATRGNLDVVQDATMPPVALRKRRIRVTTRDDLKVALESEIHAFDASQAIQTDCHISWNHFDFEVIYSSLKDEIRIDNNYLRVFIEEHDANNVSKSLTNPKNFFNEVYHGYLTGANQQMRCLCLKALSVTYSDYFAQVGTFSDTKHFVLMLQNCCDLAERDALIDVIGKLCHFKENVKQIIMAGGVELLVDMISLAHLSVGKTSIGFEQSNIIQSSETMKRDDSKEWYCLKEGDSEKCGPYSFHHMKKLYKYGEIGKNTKIWGSGMDDWKPLESVAQFRWTLVASGTAQMNETKLAVKILDILLRMIDYFPSRDLEGCIIRPPSKVKQILASSSCLPHIVQLFLTFDPDIVARTAKLLKALIQDSPMISKLYLTGLYYFALMYSGSNIMPIAELFHCSHKMQAFCSVKNGDTVAKRSILYSLLPEAAIFCLENYGAEKYAEIFLSEFDNPEVIWNSEMRYQFFNCLFFVVENFQFSPQLLLITCINYNRWFQMFCCDHFRRYLIGKIAAHVCDFTVRLPSNVKALYHYCPLPKINYAQLENEMFCHIYYLRNLCDRDRFPNWTIVEFLQSCLIAWKEEVKKKAPPMSIAEACEILELNYEDVSNNLSVVRKAYYKLAQKYHPDKNPHGREQFEKLNSAYELLASSPCNLSNTDSTVQRIVLCMRAQTLAFQIHTPIFEQYKYSGYQLLIRIIQMESEDEALFSKDGILLIRATELCCSTVECAPLNVEQLRRDNGLEVLHRAFSRCAGVIGETTKAEDLAAMVCLNICQTFAFAAKFEECRAVFSGWSSLPNEFQHIMHFRHLLKLCCSVVRCISLMCESEIMQDIFFESGIMYNLISNLFLYDCTLNSSEIQLDTEINLQCQENIYANDSCECLQSMVGLREGLNRHEKAAASIRALLSPYILHLFQSNLISNILKFVNSNIETPCFIWNGAMKVELFDYIASAEVALRSGNKLDDTKFSYKALENELCIDDVFVRVFNVSNWKNVPHINSFCRKLLDFIVDESSSSDDLQLALDAVLKLLKANQHLELHCVDVLEFLLPLLIAPRTVGFYRQFMDIFISMVGNEQCLHSIVMIPKWYVPFIQLCDQQFNSCFQVLDMFQSLASINDAVDQLLKSGCGIYFLMLFSSSQIELEVRCKVTQLLAKLQTNRLHGPRWQRFISKLLPPIFTMYMKDSAAFAVTAFDFDSQNPELVWNSKLRSHAQKVIENLTVEFLDSFADADPAEQWTIPPDVQFDCTKLLPDECVVGGISIRLFVTNPSWPLRNSKQFLIDLFAAFLSDVQNVDTDDSVVEHLQLVTKAMTLFLHVHADLCDYVASLDYLPSIVQMLSSSNREVFKASLYLIYEISKNMICVEKFGETDCMRLFYAALQNYPDMRHLTSQNLKTLLLMGNEVLLAKAVNCQLHRLLLELLGSDLPEVDDPLATKAEIVTALNTLAASNTTFGNEVNAMLNRSAIWNDYRGQNHDLFITQPTEMNFLTDADRSNASLTYQENPKNINEPPPPAAL